jgi:hypothetical protein
MRDEGIVQPVSKEMDQLSRRLHQKVKDPRRNPGSPSFLHQLRYGVMHLRGAKPLSPVDAAYIAGLIDGEGTVTVTRLHANENRRLVVSIANTELQLLRFVLERFGAGKITRKRTASEKHTPSFCYSVSGRQALELLRQTTPHLQSYKRIRSEMALERYVSLTRRNGKYSAGQLAERQRFERDLLLVRPSRLP